MKTLHNIVYGTFLILLLCVAGVFLASLMPIPGNIKVKIVKSGSMEPAIKTGSIVIIKPEANYAVGDVVTFGEDTKLAIPTSHRIVSERTELGTTFITTKGDANKTKDAQETDLRNVIGKVVFTLPYAGYLLDFAKKPVGFVLLIVIPAGLIILNELIAVWAEIRSMYARRTGRRYCVRRPFDEM